MSIKAHRGDLWIDAIKQKIQSIADAHHCEIVAMETDKDHVHILLGYDTTDSVCHIIFGKDSVLSWPNTIGRKGYSGPMGYFACSIGEVSSAIIQKYIENQG